MHLLKVKEFRGVRVLRPEVFLSAMRKGGAVEVSISVMAFSIFAAKKTTADISRPEHYI